MTLALLITAVGGAWAQTETLLTTITATGTEQASYSTANVATVSFSYLPDGSSHYSANWGWWGCGWSATVNAAEGYTITKCVFYDNTDHTATDSEAPFVVETTENDKQPKVNGNYIYQYSSSAGIKKIEVFGTAGPTEWSLTPDETGKKWTLDKMPASDVELQVEYFAESNLFLSKEALADQANITVKNGETTVEFDDDGKSATTVTEGTPMTVKFNGTKKLLGMKAAKKAPTLLSIQIDGHVTATIYYFEGETWEQAIQNHPTENSAWKIQNGYISGNGVNLTAGDNYEKVNPNSTIDPKANYHLMWT